MLFKVRSLFVFLCAFLWTTEALASPPNLSINPQDYRYTMSVTAVLVENCVELANPNNMLIAYSNGQLRGFVNSSTAVGTRYMAFLTVYSNSPSGDTITFQIYKADTDQLLAVKTTLLFQDDGIYGNPSAPLEINTNNRPTNLQLSTVIIPESQTGPPNLSTISAQDIDKDNTLSYALVPGTNSTDNAFFKVVGNQLQFNGTVPTLSTQDTFHIRLSATDNFGCAEEKDFALIVDRVNDAPTALQLSDSTFFENTNSPFVGFFIPTDPDLNDRFHYSLTAGTGDTDNGNFLLSDSALFFKGTANFEVKKIYSIHARVTDAGGLFYEKTFTLFVKDNNDPPTNIVLSNKSVYENEPATQFVAKLSTIDEDAVDRYEYTFANIGTNDNFSFSISHDSLKANKVFDFETKNTYVIYLTSTDSSGLAVTKPFVISIKDTLDAPTDILLDNNAITEGAPKGTFIGLLSTVDPNLPSVYTYSLVLGKGSDDNISFNIDHDSLFSNLVFDYEKKSSYTLRIRTSLVNKMFVEKVFLINIRNIPSTDITLSNTKVFENEPAKQFVAKVSTVSLDTSDTYTYSFGNVGTNDNTSFSLSHDSLFAKKVFDFETKNEYYVYLVSTSLSGLAITRPFTIAIEDTLDVPLDLTLDNTSLPENSAAPAFVGKLSTVDANTQPVVYTYTFVSGTGSGDSSSFSIRHDSLYAKEVFDFEKKTEYNLRLRSTLVNGMYVEKAFVIKVLNVNETPTSIALTHDSIPENTADSSFVGYFSTVDPDIADRFTYSFVSGTTSSDSKAFVIRGNKLILIKAVNYEQKSTYQLQVRTTDAGGAFLDSLFTIYIQDVNEPPHITPMSYSIPELAEQQTELGSILVTDEDRNQTYAFEILSADVPFSIDPATGMLRLNGHIDYEKQNLYLVAIKVTDSGIPALFDSLTVKINILDEIEDDQLPSADMVSPNGDGYNDYWKIRNVGLYKNYKLTIVDENSQLVYSVDSNYNNDWDAHYHGNPLPNGIYHYIFKSTTDDKVFKGYITVIK
jgi:gliding motility-associated-like protein